ncbi:MULTISPECIES: LysE family translocator [Pseudomonas]|uniref:Threonine/homoserine/homoserine lactone efflux protein n=1 Tax=Pseudomonas indica TaxID=137658 RepID=A0A1G9CMX4_9PSED|nr:MULTISPECIES: LysE family translocator [Pseudomonas]PAU56670.1 lysine transporter LysE [Pseudomonas sp. PIC25]PAU60854.1 lysine transporter LysE [Pseudomonas indica]SDK53030.1 Threonine/homoserine/homoserine lactone efflux protein [Pseudomonas indica]
MLSTEFLITSLIVVLIPGTGVVFTLSAGLFLGWRASLFAALGCTVGIVPHLLASIVGLAAVLHMSAVAFTALKFAGVAYLLYLAWAMWNDKGSISFSRPGETRAWNIAVKAFLTNILNPKLSIFFLAFLPQFVTPGADSLAQMLVLSGVFMAMTLVVFVAYGVLAFSVRRWFLGSPRLLAWMRRSFAAVFAGLGVNLALSGR